MSDRDEFNSIGTISKSSTQTLVDHHHHQPNALSQSSARVSTRQFIMDLVFCDFDPVSSTVDFPKVGHRQLGPLEKKKKRERGAGTLILQIQVIENTHIGNVVMTKTPHLRMFIMTEPGTLLNAINMPTMSTTTLLLVTDTGMLIVAMMDMMLAAIAFARTSMLHILNMRKMIITNKMIITLVKMGTLASSYLKLNKITGELKHAIRKRKSMRLLWNIGGLKKNVSRHKWNT
ncbi:hypothetical protein K1719_004114 [Acacia pycnantha]|nr:hypothetical protein K1719_004114 [Acacia pycnantha]